MKKKNKVNKELAAKKKLLNIPGLTEGQKHIIDKFPIVHVIWEDAHSANGWHGEKDIDGFAKSEEGIISEIGYLIKSTSKYIVLASKISPEGMFGGLMKIPKTWMSMVRIT